MRCNLSGPLAAALLLSVASVPCPAAWLDDTTHNVGVEAILAPRGTIDSGQTNIPRCVVATYGDSTESFWVHLAINDGTPAGYLDSLWLTGLAPAERETVAFPAWIPRGRDSVTVTAWTECVGDTFPADDTCRQRFLVRVKDIAVSQILTPAPDTTLDSGDVIDMQCRVWNYGNQSLNFDVRFRIYRLDTTVVFEAFRNLSLIAGGATIVTSPAAWEPVPGVYIAEVYAIVPGDLRPENNVLCDTFTVGGTINRDASAGYLYFDGPWPIHVGDTVIPGTTIGYNSLEPDSLWAYIGFIDSGGTRVYYESLHVFYPDTTGIYWFPAFVFQSPGLYEAYDSVYLPGDQNHTNDVKKIILRVHPPVGVAEGPKPQALSHKPQPTILSGASGVKRLASCVVFDAMGRRVTNPKPGVYFVREEPQAASLKPQAVRKVIVGR
jgi:hypothetical protein